MTRTPSSMRPSTRSSTLPAGRRSPARLIARPMTAGRAHRHRALVWALGVLALLGALLHAVAAQAREPTPAELERWFNSDELEVPGASTANVNEGQLVFLGSAPAKPVHYHANFLEIRPSSLRDGWVRLTQCHTNIDRVGRAQILFRKGRTRGLAITAADNIDQAWVEGDSVQLRNIHARARLCVAAWTRALTAHGDGSYSLISGPFMRKFLDGYYPMHVSTDVRYSGTGLNLVSVSPTAQTGFRVWEKPAEVRYDAWFEGRLKTELRFTARTL